MPEPAGATNYCGEPDHGIWLIQDLKRAYGSWAEVQKVHDSLVVCTSGVRDGHAGAWHTVGVRLSADGSNFLEVGITRDVACPFCNIQNRVFGEYKFYPTIVGPFYYDTYNPDGATVDMKVTNVPGTFDWNLYWDRTGGGLNWIFLDRFDGLSSQVGWAWGEHARWGNTGTGGFDHHYDAQFKNSNGNWQNITTLICWIDNDADWEWKRITDHEFIIQEGTRLCEPHE